MQNYSLFVAIIVRNAEIRCETEYCKRCASKWHIIFYGPHSAQAATYTTHNKHKRRTTSVPTVGFEPGISVVERLQTYALERTATGIGADPITTYNKETNVQDCTFELGAVARQDVCRHVPNKTISNPGHTTTISCNPLSYYILLCYNVLK